MKAKRRRHYGVFTLFDSETGTKTDTDTDERDTKLNWNACWYLSLCSVTGFPLDLENLENLKNEYTWKTWKYHGILKNLINIMEK